MIRFAGTRKYSLDAVGASGMRRHCLPFHQPNTETFLSNRFIDKLNIRFQIFCISLFKNAMASIFSLQLILKLATTRILLPPCMHPIPKLTNFVWIIRLFFGTIFCAEEHNLRFFLKKLRDFYVEK